MTRHLVLARHSESRVDPHTPVSQWHLSERGRARCATLADRLVGYLPAAMATSPEPKALETATIVAERLGRRASDIEVVRDLHEHARDEVPWLAQDEFDARVREFFARRDARVLGSETAAEAQLRFTRAVTRLLARHPDEHVLVFAHGTVITLFVTACTRQEPFAFWRRLQMPSFVVLSRPGLSLERVETRVDAVQR
jgi:broad specificity phosphatase PhoE